jgi:citrate lyase subunit beta/citryl-CoA lyase
MLSSTAVVPRRSLLYMPGANARALEKAQHIDCDAVIFDLEDAVAPDAKSQARAQVQAALVDFSYGPRELIVRCNGLDTPWGRDDLKAFANAPIDGLLFPKIERTDQVTAIKSLLAASNSTLPLWLMIETPTAVLRLEEFGGDDQVAALVMGTSDLVKELRGQHTSSRHNIAFALQRCVLTARMLGKEIFDGVHLDFRNLPELRSACEAGRAMGFDGKTLIHPEQVPIANEVFGYSAEELAHAETVLQVWQDALAQGKGVAELDGQLIENLHAQEAQRVVAFGAALRQRAQTQV